MGTQKISSLILDDLIFNFPSASFGTSRVIHADCFEWFDKVATNSIHAIVTDPPYGVKEYDLDQLEKRGNGHGGIWRIPPSFDGNERSPLPRFTALNERERERLSIFFEKWARSVVRILRPGGHVFIASNTFLSQLVFTALVSGGLEYRGQIIRLVVTLRGGDRPKSAEEEFPGVCSLPRGRHEPWGLFRKPLLAGMKISDCLREWETGGLRRLPMENHSMTLLKVNALLDESARLQITLVLNLSPLCDRLSMRLCLSEKGLSSIHLWGQVLQSLRPKLLEHHA